MPKPRTPTLATAALAVRRDIFSAIARRLVCSRQHVARVAHGDRQSKRVEHALRLAVARQRYP